MNRIVLVGCLVVLLAPVSGWAESAPDTGSDSAHIDAARATCMEFASGNDAYCDCAVSVVETHVSADHAHVDEAGTFYVHGDAPEDIHEAVAAADATCKKEHLGDVDQGHEHHDDIVLDAVQAECMAGTDDEAYCGCVRAHFNWHVPVDQVMTGDDGAPTGLKDHTADFMASLMEAEESCRGMHLDGIVEMQGS